jgi:cytochrome c oxidase subunit II
MLSQLGLWLPEASAHAVTIDRLMIAFSALALALTVPVFVLTIAFAIRYRRGKQVNREHASDRNVWLEVSWSVIPFLLILGFFVFSARVFFAFHRRPADALPVDAVAKQWMWKFQHPGGQREINQLHVPVGTPVAVTMTSQDVIHSLYIPALRIKQDVLPGRYTRLFFTATEPGTYRLHCAEFCGTDHSLMGGAFVAMTPAGYGAWLRGADRALTPAGAGKQLYDRLNCGACHQGDTRLAPPLAKLYGGQVRLADDSRVTADEQYLHDAITDPNAQIVAGYRPIMPTYRAVLNAEEVRDLVAYLRLIGRRPEGSR